MSILFSLVALDDHAYSVYIQDMFMVKKIRKKKDVYGVVDTILSVYVEIMVPH